MILKLLKYIVFTMIILLFASAIGTTRLVQVRTDGASMVYSRTMAENADAHTNRRVQHKNALESVADRNARRRHV